MNMCGHRHSGVEPSEQGYTTGRFILVQDEQFDTVVGAGLPGLVLGQRHVRKHETMKRQTRGNARLCCRVRMDNIETVTCWPGAGFSHSSMLLFREKIPT